MTTTTTEPRQLPLFELWTPVDAEASVLGRLGIRNPLVLGAINRGDFDYLARTMHELETPVDAGEPPTCEEWVNLDRSQLEAVKSRVPGRVVVDGAYLCDQAMHFRYVNVNPDREPPRLRPAWVCFAHTGEDPNFHGSYRVIEPPRPRLQTAPDFDLFAEIRHAIDGAAADLYFEVGAWHLRHEGENGD